MIFILENFSVLFLGQNFVVLDDTWKNCTVLRGFKKTDRLQINIYCKKFENQFHGLNTIMCYFRYSVYFMSIFVLHFAMQRSIYE